MAPQLTFVYNASTGFFNKLTDFAHKVLSPQTYACNLCALTYGTFTMKAEWAAYLDKLGLEIVFMYKDTWEAAHDPEVYPLVALQTQAGMKIILPAAALTKMTTLHQLQTALSNALQKVNEV